VRSFLIELFQGTCSRGTIKSENGNLATRARGNGGRAVLLQTLSYVGDARIADLQPNEERLISYAVDLGTEVKPEAEADSGRLTHLKGIKGMLYTTTTLREKKTYAVRDRNPQGRNVRIGHPVRDQFQLVDTTMLVQTARDAYRFEAQVPVGKAATLAATEERDLTSTALLTDSADEQVRVFLQSPVVSDKVKEGLKKAQELRREWAGARREAGERQRQLQAVAEDQARLRANLREVPQTPPLHRRYLGQLGRQEGEVEKYRAEAHSIFILCAARWCPRRDLPPWPGGRSEP
jgi:hypothetical protein